MATSTSSSSFRLMVSSQHLNGMIDSRDTVANYIFGPQIANLLFRVARKYGRFFATLSLLTAGFWIISVIGLYDVIGYGCVLALPYQFQVILLSNVMLLKLIFRSFDFWVLLVLAIVFYGAMIGAMTHSPARIVALICAFVDSLIGVIFDAKFPIKARNNKRFVFMVAIIKISSVWILLFCWYLGLFIDVQETVIEMPFNNALKIDVQSFAVNCYFTWAVFFTKHTFVMIFSKESNKMILIKPYAYYEYINHTNMKSGTVVVPKQEQEDESSGV
jgi:hypothetical protein